jgi:hypothetical protein
MAHVLQPLALTPCAAPQLQPKTKTVHLIRAARERTAACLAMRLAIGRAPSASNATVAVAPA